MTRADDIERIVIAAHALTRIAALSTQNDAPSAQWRALSLLQQGPLRVGDLARLARTTQPGMTRLVGQLVDQGLVTRTNDPDDSRATVVAPTEAGSRALAAWKTELGTALEPLFADLTEAEWAALEHASRILTERAEAVPAATR
ncbi:MarR family winged helix-turn-helix transcriptional regulator [Microbacterium sp. GXF7504]